MKPLLDDYRQALGLFFNVDDEKGDRFFRSSLVQTAFYSLFAAWILWDKAAEPGTQFEIDDAHAYLPIPFLDALQVRRAHYIVKTELGRPRGLADPEVVVLDPCCAQAPTSWR